MRFTITQFQERYPDEAACLEEIRILKYGHDHRCPKCGRDKWHRIKMRPVYSCQCGHQINPLAGTIFEKTRTPLRSWFYVMFLMTATRSGVAAKQVERELGVTYKTAWRMMKQIRTLMKDEGMLYGHVEADETFISPKTWRNSRIPRGYGMQPRQIVMGVVERGGAVRVKHIEAVTGPILRRSVHEMVTGGSHVFTDGAIGYRGLAKEGYGHTAIQHWTPQKDSRGMSRFVPQEGDSTQQIENFWAQFKRGLYGVYRHCGPKYLQSYAEEYAWRYSRRKSSVRLYDLLLAGI